MIQRKILTPLAAVFTAVAIMLVGASGIVAAAGSSDGLRVSPVRTDLTINPGQIQTVQVTVTNVTSQDGTYQAVVNDFTAGNDESGTPAILVNPNQYAPSHSLKRFVQAIPDFTLAAGQQKTISVAINVPTTAAGGGYFGTVRFAPASVGEANKTVTLAGSVGTLVLLTVPGNIVDKMSISSFDARTKDSPSTFFTGHKNINAVVRFNNQGNVQEEPFGKILLKNHSGKTLATYEVNNSAPRGNVLPNSIRKFSIPLSHVGSFGIFKLEGNFGYGTNGQLLSASTTFYVVPLALILIFLLLVVVLLLLIFGMPRLVRSYNQRVIRRAGRR